MSNFEKNAQTLCDRSHGLLDYRDAFVIAKTLHLDSGHIFRFKNAIHVLACILRTDPTFFQGNLIDALKCLTKVTRSHKEYLDRVGPPITENTKGLFEISDATFNKNVFYGLYAGLDASQAEKLTLKFNPQTPPHIPLLSLGFLGLTVLNKVQGSDPVIDGLKTYARNLKYLASNPAWQKVLDDFINQSLEQQEILNIKDLLLRLDETKTGLKDKDHLSLIKKSKEITQFLIDYRGFNSTQTSNDKTDTLTQDIEILIKSVSNPYAPLPEFSIPSVKDENPFLKSLGFHRDEKDTHILKLSNRSILPSEIKVVEQAISSKDSTIKDSVKLTWSLMLYYAIPLNKIPTVLVGSPFIDHDEKDMVGKVIIDVDHNCVYLPTPMHKLVRKKDHDCPPHLPLPLHENTKAILKKLLFNVENARSLSQLIKQNDLKLANSYSGVQDFRQYRITAKKVSDALWRKVLWDTKDEVKTAYLHGGAYQFIHMGTYYTRFKTDDLVKLYTDTAGTLFNQCKYLSPIKPLSTKFLGSDSVPPKQDVIQFLRQKRELIRTLHNEAVTEDDFWRFHNELTLYTILTLCLATTHRPSADPFYSLKTLIGEDFIQITEKVVMTGFEGRVSLINDVCQRQLKNYLSHLNRIITELSEQAQASFFIELSKVIAAKNNPRLGLPLFFLVQNSKVKSITKSTLASYLSSIPGIELKDNFFRHVFSTYMSECAIPRFLISAQMGHVFKGMETYSNSLDFSPQDLKEQLLEPLNNLFTNYNIKPTPYKLNPQKCQVQLSQIKFKLSPLGPFKRSENLLLNLDERQIKAIEKALFTTDTELQNLFISNKLRKHHRSILKAQGNRSAERTLDTFYEHMARRYKWRFEASRSLQPSPFNKKFGDEYTLGEQYFQQIEQLIDESIFHNSRALTPEQLRVLLGLSTLISGSVLQKELLIAVINIPLDSIDDVGLTKAVQIKLRGGGQKLWLVNSLGMVILKKLEAHNKVAPLNEDCISAQLTKLRLPKLENLIFKIKAYLRMELPAFMIHYSSTPCRQSNMGTNGLKSLINACSSTSLQNTSHSAPPLKRRFRPNQSKQMRAFVKAWRFGVNHQHGRKQLLDELKQLRRQEEYSLAEQLLVDWIFYELESNTIQVSTIAGYFSNIHPFILKAFSDFTSLEEIDDALLIETIYPEVLSEIQKKYGPNHSHFSAELNKFHQFFASSFEFAPLKFYGSKIKCVPITHSTLNESAFQECLRAIDQDPNTSHDSKTALKLTLIIYKRCGLRLSEVFKIKSKDVLLEEKMIHSHGERNNSQKSRQGNRLLPYRLLMSDKEISLLESWVRRQPNDALNRPLLFGFLTKVKSREISGRVESYLKTLMRSVTGDSSLTIKSLRRTFATDVFLKIALNDPSHPVTSKIDLLQRPPGQELISYCSPQSKFWMLADWIGHTTPQTTFNYYALSMDLACFSLAERFLQNKALFNKSLHYLGDDLSLKESTYKNLNRYKACKFADFYSRYLTKSIQPKTTWQSPSYVAFFKNDITLEQLESVLACFAQNETPEKVAEILFLPVSDVKRIFGSARMILFELSNARNTPPSFIKKILDSILAFKYSNGALIKERTAHVSDKLIPRFMDKREADFKAVYTLWIGEAAQGVNEKQGLFFYSQKSLETFLNFYKDCFFDEVDEEGIGGLYVEVIGYDLKPGQLNLKLEKHNSLIHVEDRRETTQTKLPVSHFYVSQSTRRFDSLKKATSKKALHRAIFLTKIYKDLGLSQLNE